MLALINIAVFAQSGTIKGTVKDKNTGEEVIGANVLIKGTTTGTATDVFGNFQFNASAGAQTITVSYIGYKDWTGAVQVAANGATTLNVDLDPDLVELEGVVIRSKAERSGSEVLLLERKKAATMVENLGVQEMAVKGVSNVEDGLTKMSGIAKVGAKGVFVRGLGDRYNSATLNGLPVPATNPDLKMIPLSIFPTDVVEAISVSKTFNANEYGDFGGAAIDIGTKTYPEEAFLSLGGGISANSITTGKRFSSFKNGQFERLGFSGNGRTNPLTTRNVPSVSESGQPFENGFTPTVGNAPVGFDFSARGGKKYELGVDSHLGFIASVAHENNYSYKGGTKRNLNAQAAEMNNFERDEYVYSTLTTALLGVNYALNDQHNFTYNVLFANTSDNTNSELFGYIQDVNADDILIRRNTYTQTQLLTNQLLGSHELNTDGTLAFEWGGSYSTTNRVEPDRRQNSFRTESNRLLQLNASQNHRFWSDMDENEVAAKANFSYKHGMLNEDETKGEVKFGYQGRFKGRQMKSFQYNLRATGEEGLKQPVYADNPDAFFTDENYEKGYYTYTNGIDVAQHEFEAFMNVNAAFVTYDYNFSERLKAIAGVRYENGLQEVHFRSLRNAYDDPFRISEYKTNDFLPSISLKYALNDKTNFRLAASKTLTRPGMREIIPFQYQDIDGNLFEGNKDLENSTNYNVDLKYEYFPNSGDVFSVALFGKRINDAIEMTQVAQGGGNLFTYTNTEAANVYGTEIELNKNLGAVLGEDFDGFSVGFNTTLMVSEIKLKEGDDKSAILTNQSRALQGASPYLLNANVAYNHEFGQWNTTFSGVFNMFGDRVYAAGQQGAGDIYEKGVPRLDFIWKNQIAENWSVDLKVRNILNPEIERYQQDFSDTQIDRQLVDAYHAGMDFSISLSYLIK